MKTKDIVAAVAATVVFAAAAFSPGPVSAESQKPGESSSPRLTVTLDAESIRYMHGSGNRDDKVSGFKGRDIHLGVSAKLTKSLRANLRLGLARLLGLEESDDDGDSRIEDLLADMSADKGAMDSLEEALEFAELIYTHDQETDKMLKTVLFGKGTTALRELVTSNPVYKDSLLYEVAHQDDVIGITFEVDPGEIARNIEASVSECGEDEILRISDCVGFAAAMNDISTPIDNLTANAGVLVLVIDPAPTPMSNDWEKRARVGLVYDNGSGIWKAYANGVYLDSAEQTGFATQVGAEVAVGPGQVVVEFEYFEDMANQWVVAYNNIPLGANLMTLLSLYVRYRFNDEVVRADSTEVGLNVQTKFGRTSLYVRHRFNDEVVRADSTEVGLNVKTKFGWTPQIPN